MSDTICVVRFEDGALLYGRYNGCGDCVINPLTTNPFCAMELREFDTDTKPEKEENVQIFSSYGSGVLWEGTACYNTKQVIKAVSPYEYFDDIPDSAWGNIPDWAIHANALANMPRSKRY